MKLLVVRVRSPKNEEVVIPSSLLLTSNVVNLSTFARQQKLILHTTVGIGYETSWRQVEAMLKLAAGRTPDLLREPAPSCCKRRSATSASPTKRARPPGCQGGPARPPAAPP
jgi:small-conductance mechanosensitive channel